MRERILEHLERYGSITTWEAITEYGCTRLSEYIRQIRLEHEVKDKWISTTNRFGEKVSFKKYYIGELEEE